MLLEMSIIPACFVSTKKNANLLTLRSIYGRGKSGAWLFDHKLPFTLQEHVKMTKTDFYLLKLLPVQKWFLERKILLPDKERFPNLSFQSTKNRRRELCVDNKVQETIADAFCPTC